MDTAVSDVAVSALLSEAPPPVTADDAVVLLDELWGIAGKAAPLTSERDHNFRIDARDGRRFVLKLTHPSEDVQVTNLQTEALRHIERVARDLPVPRMVAALTGEFEPVRRVGKEAPRIVRLMSWLDGVPLHELDTLGSSLRQELGATLAGLGRALRGFFHPAAGHRLLWDLKHAEQLQSLLAHLPAGDQRDMADRFLADHLSSAGPIMPGLRAQVVHNDLNFYNVMVTADQEPRLAGIIDFGDMVHTPLICDLAVAAAYQLSPGPDAVQQLTEFVSAYHAVTPLERNELQLLPILIATRCVMTVAITGWRAARHPENRDYILRNNPSAWRNLEYLANLPPNGLRDALFTACPDLL